MENAVTNISFEKTLTDAVQGFTVRIVASWKKVAASIIETGRVLLEAEQKLTRTEWVMMRKELTEQGIMSDPVISKLLGIARHNALCAPDNAARLPGSFTTLYALSREDEAAVQSALNEGRVTPLTQLRDLSDVFKTQGKTERQEKEGAFCVTVRGDLSKVPAEKVAALKTALEDIGEYARVALKGIA